MGESKRLLGDTRTSAMPLYKNGDRSQTCIFCGRTVDPGLPCFYVSDTVLHTACVRDVIAFAVARRKEKRST